jgi:hypothetical protein
MTHFGKDKLYFSVAGQNDTGCKRVTITVLDGHTCEANL